MTFARPRIPSASEHLDRPIAHPGPVAHVGLDLEVHAVEQPAGVDDADPHPHPLLELQLCKLDVAVSLLPLEIPLLARVAQSRDCRLLAVEWRLPEPCHPLLRPDRASGAVTSAPTYEFLTLQIPARPRALAESIVAESAPASRPVLPPVQPAPPLKPERSITISAAWVPSRSRRLPPKPPGHYVPFLRITAQWLAGAGFDIGQRVRVQAERGRLVLTSGDAAAGSAAHPGTLGSTGKPK
jgi:hypothetical protein